LNRSQREKIRILCPGSGLGRLPWEIARKGFACQGNEFSYQMLLVSNYIFNYSSKKESIRIFPYIHTCSNHIHRDHQLKSVLIPNVDIADEMLSKDFSTNAGEFIEVYSPQPESWDCITTCFFIDTAHNIIEYIQTIYALLQPGGLWVNLGPLLYHYEDMPSEQSIELSFDEIIQVIRITGFDIIRHEERVCTYTRNPKSMMHLVYNCQFITCKKKEKVVSSDGDSTTI
jgi:carnosine N-methyltransferase